jgi:hypothetical protein
MTHRYTVWPLRFSPSPAAMIEFFAVLGLHNTLSHAERTFATFDGRSGKLGVHSAADTASSAVTGHTSLNFTTADITSAVQELAAMGLKVHSWDETYGKQGVIVTPQGTVIGLNEDTQDDLYGGYQVHGRPAATSLDVVAVCHTDDIAREAAYFAYFGFTANSVSDSRLAHLYADGNSGILALRQGDAASQPTAPPAGDQFGPPYTVQLAFKTNEPLDALAKRLRDSGYKTATSEDQAGAHVSVTDPDGQEIQIGQTA